MVRSERLELSWESHTALNRACLPISARPLKYATINE